MKSRISTTQPDAWVGSLSWIALLWVALLVPSTVLLVSGCRAHIGAQPAPVSRLYHQSQQSALDGSGLSQFSRATLHRFGAEQEFRRDPSKILRRLHAEALAGESRDLLLVLAELNYYQADHLRRSVRPGAARPARDYFLLSSIYAYYYLLGEPTGLPPSPFGPQPELARNLYNRGLARGLLGPGATNAVVRLEPGTRQLLVGPLQLHLNTNALGLPLARFTEFVMADAYALHGLSVRNRQVGLGAPLIGTAVREEDDFAPARLAVSVFLRLETSLPEWSRGQINASLEVYPGHPGSQVLFGKTKVPLEIDATAPLAYALDNSLIWSIGRRQFLTSREIIKSGVYRLQPYQPGRIPVVFVHGTLSSPACWAEMWNSLGADPVLSRHYQFWAFIYNTGNPVVWSAARFRESLLDTVERLDPEGLDTALQHVVIIGHSQGGLLAKLAVTRAEDKLWRAVSDEPLEALQVSPALKAELRRTLFVEPVPCVSRVIFVATPHRGSYRASGLVRTLAGRLVSLPADLVRYTREQASLGGRSTLSRELRRKVPTSVEGMSPQSPLLPVLAELPPASGVSSHSIIAVKGHRPLEQDNDGVVTYQSAHVSYTTSELVVRSSHSCQGNPATIEEVRRILLAHVADINAAGGKL